MTVITRRAVATGLALSPLSAAPAAWAAEFGPVVGAKAPAFGALADQEGVIRNLADLAGPRGTVLMFYRSAGWCPFCQAQLIAMQTGVGMIERRGYRLVGISYEGPDVNKTFTQRRGITFPLLSDPGARVIAAWGLRDPQYPEGHRAFGVPRPVIYVIDRQNTIRARLAEEAYQNRPPVAEVLKAIGGIR
jgi:peroxiredoxin